MGHIIVYICVLDGRGYDMKVERGAGALGRRSVDGSSFKDVKLDKKEWIERERALSLARRNSSGW
jgi:hypothetical protein